MYKMTGEEVFNIIRDLVEVDEKRHNDNPKYPQYIKAFVESGDKASIETLDYPIMVIENHMDNLKEYVTFTNFQMSIGRYIFNVSSVKDAFTEIRDFCKVRMTSCPTKYESRWRDLHDRIQKIITTLVNDLSLRSTFTVNIDGKEYSVDLLLDGTDAMNGEDIMEILQTVCNVYSSGHGLKVKMNWEEAQKDDNNRKSVQ